jgi:hypothetical protein
MREYKRRTKGRIPEKSSPYHKPMWKVDLESEMIKTGVMDPTILGVEVDQKDILKAQLAPRDGGRPSGAKDQTKRKPKVVRPRATAESVIETQVWAKESLDKISDIITPNYVMALEKAYARDLTNVEVDDLENIKLAVLGAHDPFSDITEDSIKSACANLMDSSQLKVVRDAILQRFNEKFKRKPTIEDRRIAAAAAFSLINS